MPVAGYVGHFRGDPTVKELIDYEGLGARLKDGNLEKMGVWARKAGEEMHAVLAGLHAVFAELDASARRGSHLRPPTRYSKSSALPRSPTVNSCGFTPSPMATASPDCWSRSSACGTGCRCSCMSSRGRKATTTSAPAVTRWADHPGQLRLRVFAHLLADELAGDRVG